MNYERWRRTTDERDETHARLIAAAPDLLAACEMVIGCVARPDEVTLYHDEIAEIRAAIAKARG